MTLTLTQAGVQAAQQAADAIPLTLTPAGHEAAAAAAHLAHLGEARDWWENHPGARLPASPVINVRVNGTTPEEKAADLEAIAASWGVEVQELDRDLGRVARLTFGGYTYEAHVAARFKTHKETVAAHRPAKEAAA